jgi:prenyltransferase beta subunit
MKRIVSASLLILSFAPALRSQTPEQKQSTVKWLQELQVADGGFVPIPVDGRLDTDPRGSLRATSSALRALKHFGGAPKDKEAAAKFVMRCYDAESGAFAGSPNGKADVFTTAVGLMAAVELKLGERIDAEKCVKYMAENAKEFEDIRIAAAGMETCGKLAPHAERWCRFLLGRVNADGSYGDGVEKARATGGTVVTILRLGGKVEHPDRIIDLLNRAQNNDGGFGKDDTGSSDLETTYRIMRCYHMLKAKPAKVDSLNGFIAKCRNPDGGYGVQPGRPSTVSGPYFAGIITHWLTEP